MVEQHEKTLVPQIRFAGFTDPWEQRKLGEFGSVAMCKRIYKEQTSEQGDVPFFKIGTFGANPDAFISNELFEDFKCIYPYPTPGTLLISAAGSIGRVVEYQGEKAYFQDSNIVWLEHDHRLNDAFLKPLYSRIEWGLEGSTIKRLYNKDLLSAEVTVPGGREQKEIGQFFAKLDNLITLHQRKYDKLCVLKKSMLDKMFPKGGSLYPEIRFSGFTDPWEQRKLGELASKRIEKNSNGIKETFTNSAEHGVVSQLDYFDHDITNDANIGNYSVVYPDDFVYNPRISTIAPCGPINRNKLGRNGVMSPLYTVFSVDDMISKLYLEHYFKTNRWHQFMFLEGNSGARSDRFSISDSIFFEMPIQCPVLEEQELIASFFDRLDSLITLHQRKLELLRNIKKSMLDKMFV
ncbi:restriction endonuclease subunit S [Bifidobacterium pseudocatenulatum]|uniref:restriction endonuclease subunit S n=1 Tax=Bifidobacterium pseudocatenulatum TaxID=28026 RepID=UPI00232C81A2|nr:restriction endonuclease subunit S [Bifidobacterium pseudocatenulatum]MDB6509508.1 restriction endonuclease subunit S [Bifidobacterium pseudocatenulatum]